MPEYTPKASPKLPELTHLMLAGSLKSDHEEHWFYRREEFREEHLGTFVPSIHSSLVSIKPLLCSPQEREWKQTEPDCILRYTLDNKSTAELQELLEMSAGILIGPATKWAGLHHRNETRLDLEIFSVNLGSGWDLASRRSRVITECLLGHSSRCSR